MMNDSPPEDEQVDAMLRQALDRPRPALSPFFASRVTNIAVSSKKGRRPHPLMNIYWFLLLAGAIFLTINFADGRIGQAMVLALVPTGFAVALYWKSLLSSAIQTMELLFGSRF